MLTSLKFAPSHVTEMELVLLRIFTWQKMLPMNIKNTGKYYAECCVSSKKIRREKDGSKEGGANLVPEPT